MPNCSILNLIASKGLGFGKLITGTKDINAEFEYELKQDSLIVIKPKNSKGDIPLVIRKFSDKFDYIEIFDLQ